MSSPFLAEAQAKMKKTVDHTLHEFSSIHTGKATPQMVETVMVEAYGTRTPLKQCAAISTPDARLIQVQPWDTSLIKDIIKGIQEANLGFNPIPDGKVIRIPLPDMSKERRLEFVKNANRLAEEGRVHVRNVRRDIIEAVKKAKEKKATFDLFGGGSGTAGAGTGGKSSVTNNNTNINTNVQAKTDANPVDIAANIVNAIKFNLPVSMAGGTGILPTDAGSQIRMTSA
jgi:ribosome recycling factor